MTRKFGLPALLIAAFLVAGVAWAGDGKAGSTYLPLLDIGPGAGPSAMSAYVGAPGDMWSLTYNPAGLANIDRLKLGVSQIEWQLDTSFTYLGVGLPRGEGGLAMGVAYFDKGSIEQQSDDLGFVNDETAEAYDFAFIGGYGFDVPNVCNLAGGVSGHVIQATLDDESATAIGLNMGFLYGLMEQQVHVGLAVRNLGTKLKFIEEEEEQALTYAGGISYTTLPDQIQYVDLLIGLDAAMPKGQDVQVGVGGEVWVYEMLALRVGYSTASESGNLRYGAGFRYSDFQLDYTYTDFDEYNEDTHRISLTMAFGD